MIRTYLTKDNNIIDVDTRHRKTVCTYTGTLYESYIEYLKEFEYTECFDPRKFTNLNGKSHTIVLENDSPLFSVPFY